MHDFKKRLLSYISDTNVGSIREFERKCGLTNGQISSIGSQGPTASVLKKISDTCPDLNLNWLFRGEGAMTLADSPCLPPVHINNIQTINIGNWGELVELLNKK